MDQEVKKNMFMMIGSEGRPQDYPTPPHHEDSLFFIQSSQNKNTVVYEINRSTTGQIKLDYPMKIFWIKYSDGGEIQDLNYIQDKLAYGYESKEINSETFEIHFVSYKALVFYITKAKDNHPIVVCKINDEMSKLNNIFIHVEYFGVFPDVKFIELFGENIENSTPVYQKIII